MNPGSKRRGKNHREEREKGCEGSCPTHGESGARGPAPASDLLWSCHDTLGTGTRAPEPGNPHQRSPGLPGSTERTAAQGSLCCPISHAVLRQWAEHQLQQTFQVPPAPTPGVTPSRQVSSQPTFPCGSGDCACHGPRLRAGFCPHSHSSVCH